MKIWGSVYAIFTLGLWLFAASRTLPSVWDGSIFEAPCLAGQREQAILMGADPTTITTPSIPSCAERSVVDLQASDESSDDKRLQDKAQ